MRGPSTRARAIVALACLSGLVAASCATLRQIAALRRVDFSIDRVTDAKLAGVSLDRIHNPRDLSALEIAAIGLNLARGDLPFEFTLHLTALNPAENKVTARLLRMDWTLLLDDRETVSGSVEQEHTFEPGLPSDLPILIKLDLENFFQHNAEEMIDLALAVAGAGGEPKRIALRATPTIQTPLGPIRYPEPITIVSRTIGGSHVDSASPIELHAGIAPRFIRGPVVGAARGRISARALDLTLRAGGFGRM